MSSKSIEANAWLEDVRFYPIRLAAEYDGFEARAKKGSKLYKAYGKTRMAARKALWKLLND